MNINASGYIGTQESPTELEINKCTQTTRQKIGGYVADDLVFEVRANLGLGDTLLRFKSDPWRMIFNYKNEPVGTLTINNDGSIHFEGSVDESAKAFFDSVCSMSGQDRTDTAPRQRLFVDDVKIGIGRPCSDAPLNIQGIVLYGTD